MVKVTLPSFGAQLQLILLEAHIKETNEGQVFDNGLMTKDYYLDLCNETLDVLRLAVEKREKQLNKRFNR